MPCMYLSWQCLSSNGRQAASTTGKIAGVVTDKETGQPLAYANVFLEGTSHGSATNAKGEYFLINVPSGSYNLYVQMIGYGQFKVTDLRVSVNRTVHINAELNTEALQVETIVVEAKRIVIRRREDCCKTFFMVGSW